MPQDINKKLVIETIGNGMAASENKDALQTDKFAIFESRLRNLEEKGRKRGKRYSRIGLIYSIIICIAVLISGFIIIKEINEFSEQAGESAKIISEMNNNNQITGKLIFHSAWKNCLIDSDCQETQKECCPCSSGGEQISINAVFFTEWTNLLNKNCKNSVCASLYSCQIGKSVCKNNKCFFEVAEIATTTDATTTDDLTDQKIMDADNDGLTNEEEIKYGTEINNPDTDGDGFWDKEELDRGYNPKGDGLFTNIQ